VTAPVDPVVTAFREEITTLDVALIQTLNTRVEKVRALRRYKEEHGIAFLDPGREAWLTEHVQQSNSGPLSAAAVAEVCEFVLALVKRELADG
jgi:chorismate mutase